jgi:superfamily I DNA and RNA helicase
MTIAHARAGRETALTVHCLGVGRHHQAVKTFDELKLWKDMILGRL